MLRDYNLNPPNGPDVGDPCKECGEPIDGEHIPVELPGPRLAGPVYVCSDDCLREYLIGWADHVLDDNDWDWD